MHGNHCSRLGVEVISDVLASVKSIVGDPEVQDLDVHLEAKLVIQLRNSAVAAVESSLSDPRPLRPSAGRSY